MGRDDELALLERTLVRAKNGPALQLVTIVGEPGIGKTRLVAEFQKSIEARADTVRWRQGRCLAYGDGITFWALGQIVKLEAGILESDPPDEAAAKLATAVERVAPERDRAWLTRRLAPLVGASGGDDQVGQEEAFTAWRTYLETLAAEDR